MIHYGTIRYYKPLSPGCELEASESLSPRIPLVRKRPAFLRSRHLRGSDAATAVKGAKRDRSHAQPQASMARTHPLTAEGRGVATLIVGCGTYGCGSFPSAADIEEQSRLLLASCTRFSKIMSIINTAT